MSNWYYILISTFLKKNEISKISSKNGYIGNTVHIFTNSNVTEFINLN